MFFYEKVIMLVREHWNAPLSQNQRDAESQEQGGYNSLRARTRGNT